MPQAVVVSGAGTAHANGVYKVTSGDYCDAPVYEHVDFGATLKITREPHTSPKTGVLKHGWVIGQNKVPLYGVPTEAFVVPESGWRRFNGVEPLPAVQVYLDVSDLLFELADDARATGDASAEREDWGAAASSFTQGVAALMRLDEQSSESFRDRAGLLLSRRAAASLKLEDPRSALRDALASLDLVKSLASARAAASAAARSLGCDDDAALQKILAFVGEGKILDPEAPLVLRCVERWLDDALTAWEAWQQSGGDLALPEPRHLPADRYLGGLDDEAREEVLKAYLPDEFRPLGGTGVIHDPKECLQLMHKWEEVLQGEGFQQRKGALWGDRGLPYPVLMERTRGLVAECLEPVLRPMGFAPGGPGLSRAVRQMQVYWSRDGPCAQKALDLEELADVSLADLED